MTPWNPNEPYISFNLSGIYDLQPGDEVSLSNGTVTKTTLLTGLAFTDIDLDADTVSGIAAEGSQVDLWACDAVSCYNRHVIASDGTWMADFGHPGSLDDEQNTVNIVSNNWHNWRTLTGLLRHGRPGPESSLVKLFWSEMSQRLHDTAMDVLGPGAQLVRGDARAPAAGRWQRSFLYYRAATIFAGTSEIQRNIIAERVQGLPRAR